MFHLIFEDWEDFMAKYRVPWSLVIPIKDEAEIVARTLPNYLALCPLELVVCMDDPPDDVTYHTIYRVLCEFPELDFKFVFVKRDTSWGYHQAYVRRAGFDAASHDLILTGDIDLVVNQNCHEALQTLLYKQENGVGLVSCAKFYWPAGLVGLYRTFSTEIATLFGSLMHRLKGEKSQVGNFTGLYAFSKSRWQDTEPREKVMQMVSPKALLQPKEALSPKASDYRQYYCGEDTFLRDYMLTKYQCVYLGSVGGVSLRPAISNDPVVQFFVGMYERSRGRNLLKALLTTFMYFRPYYFMGYRWKRRH